MQTGDDTAYTGKVVKFYPGDEFTVFIKYDGQNVEFKRFFWKLNAKRWLKRRLKELNNES